MFASVIDPQETAQFPSTQLDCAIFGSWVGRALEANARIVHVLDEVVMPFGVAVQAWQQLERQNSHLHKMRNVLEARKAELDAAAEEEEAEEAL